MSDIQEAVRWEISVPIWKHTVIMNQLGLSIGIPLSLVALAIVLASGIRRDTLYALGLMAALLILTWLFIMAVYRGKYAALFVLDGKGALCRTGAAQAKQNRIINTLTVMLGLLAGKPSAAGAGILAQSRQEAFLRWSRVTSIKYSPQKHTILLRGGWTEQMALFCTKENYETVEAFVRRRIPAPGTGDNR